VVILPQLTCSGPTPREAQFRKPLRINHTQLVRTYLEVNETVNNKQAREITFIHEDWKVEGIFRRMEKNKMIRQVPGTVTSQIKYRKWKREDDNQGEFELKSE
jgi:hypothetical protein